MTRSQLASVLFQEPAMPVPAVEGLALIEAAGDVGEARLIARRIRHWMNESVKATAIVVTGRDLAAKLPLLREVFDEYAVPATWPEAEPIALCGAVKLLSRFWRLADEDYLFRDVAAVWRNVYFRPAFDPHLPLAAESLLRELEVPLGRRAYLAAIQQWADEVAPAPLEDESMEHSSREERSKLAKRCLGFFHWYFGLWDTLPERATAAGWTNEVRRIAKELGIAKAPMPGAMDEAAIKALGTALDEWAAAGDETFTLSEFSQAFDNLTHRTAWPTPVPIGGVKVLPADDAVKVECSHLVVMGLEEGAFPKLRSTADADDEALLTCERDLFRSLIALPTTALVLSRAALNAKGQELLPASFLADLRWLISEIPTESQTMLIDGYLTKVAFSTAEIRAQYADVLMQTPPRTATVPTCSANLHAAKAMAEARFRRDVPNAFSGTLSHGPVKSLIAERFGAQNVFSPTSLETYIACPFKFWQEKVLGLKPPEEPPEDVDVRRKGSTIHRALARYHAAKPHERPDRMADELRQTWDRAVAESAERAPGAAARMLWRLEGRRVQRAFNRYPAQWSTFRERFVEAGDGPTPHSFEAQFGTSDPNSRPVLAITVDGVEVRIRGVIDRIDIAALDDGEGFWIIDYKSGRGDHYTATSLWEYERLQLPLYALAVERLFPGGPRRPLGLAYWMIVKDGPKLMMPSGRKPLAWLQDPDQWSEYRDGLIAAVACVATALRGGDFRLAPRTDSVCEYCDFAANCRINQHRGRLTPLPLVASP